MQALGGIGLGSCHRHLPSLTFKAPLSRVQLSSSKQSEADKPMRGTEGNRIMAAVSMFPIS